MLHSRNKRIEESLKQGLSQIFQSEISDPRLPAIFTISRVHVAKDMRDATAHYSQLPDDEAALDATEEMLEDCIKFVRNRLAQMVNLKFTPELHFRYSPAEKHYQNINSILKTLDIPEESDEPEESGG